MRSAHVARAARLVALGLTLGAGCGAQPRPATTNGTSSAMVVLDVPPPASAALTSAAPLPRQPLPPPDDDADLNPDKPHCRPLPKVGSACTEGQSYCVVDWGSPGGHSTALWCRDGAWHRIEEQNLD